MTKPFALASMFTLCSLLSSGASVASERVAAPSAEATRAISVHLTTTAVSKSCDADTDVERTITVCTADGCSTMDLNDKSTVSFVLERAGNTSFELMASSVYKEDNVVRGDTVVDTFTATSDAQRFTQVVEGKNGCLRSFSYDVK